MDGFIFDSGFTSTGGSIGTGSVDVGPSDSGHITIPYIPGVGSVNIPIGTANTIATQILNPLSAQYDTFQQKLQGVALTAGVILLAFIIFAIGLYTIVSE